MNQRIDDTNLTVEEILNLSPQEYRNLENRLRNMAKSQGLSVKKMRHPVHGDHYHLADENDHFIAGGDLGFNIAELIDWLYENEVNS